MQLPWLKNTQTEGFIIKYPFISMMDTHYRLHDAAFQIFYFLFCNLEQSVVIRCKSLSNYLICFKSSSWFIWLSSFTCIIYLVQRFVQMWKLYLRLQKPFQFSIFHQKAPIGQPLSVSCWIYHVGVEGFFLISYYVTLIKTKKSYIKWNKQELRSLNV